MNIAVVRGQVLREPVERELASGTQLSIDLNVSYEEGPNETVEVVWLNPPDKSRWPRQGVEVFVTGRVRRRFFRLSNGQTAGRMELVADTVLTAKQTRQINRRLEAVAADVAG